MRPDFHNRYSMTKSDLEPAALIVILFAIRASLIIFRFVSTNLESYDVILFADPVLLQFVLYISNTKTAFSSLFTNIALYLILGALPTTIVIFPVLDVSRAIHTSFLINQQVADEFRGVQAIITGAQPECKRTL